MADTDRDEAVDAAARAMFDLQHPDGATDEHWQSACGDYWRAAAHAAVGAAAPWMESGE